MKELAEPGSAIGPQMAAPPGRKSMGKFHKIEVVDSHTAGEPTRVVLSGAPDLKGGCVAERLRLLRQQHDWFRSAVVNEPRGSAALVGALLCPPTDPSSAAAVIFFNNAGYLGMCGHGTMGVAATLAHLGRMAVGTHLLHTPVGAVQVQLHDAHRVSVRNVPSFRHRKGVRLPVPGFGEVQGDIAWGGNWFFITSDHGLELQLDNLDLLTSCAWAIRRALAAQGVCGPNGEEIDHMELLGQPSNPAKADARNFVLCPGGAYDRSPCGTGTSAKLACLMADGVLAPGEVWRQESITGSLFEARGILQEDGMVLPTISGAAYVTAQAQLLLDREDPLVHGAAFAGRG